MSEIPGQSGHALPAFYLPVCATTGPAFASAPLHAEPSLLNIVSSGLVFRRNPYDLLRDKRRRPLNEPIGRDGADSVGGDDIEFIESVSDAARLRELGCCLQQ